MNKRAGVLPALREAFPRTLGVMAGYFFLGFAYGVYAHASGFSFWYPLAQAILIYGGSLEFVVVSMLLAPFAPVTTFVMAFMIQARHLFYGLAMLGKYKGTGWKKFFLIFGMSDETFSINCSAEIPEGIDRSTFYLCVTWLDESYWIIGASVGALAGSVLPINTDGIEYVMTAMFVCIFLDAIRKEKKHYAAIIGLVCSIVCRLICGADSFLIPTMIAILVLLSIFRNRIDEPEAAPVPEENRSSVKADEPKANEPRADNTGAGAGEEADV